MFCYSPIIVDAAVGAGDSGRLLVYRSSSFFVPVVRLHVINPFGLQSSARNLQNAEPELERET